MAGFTPEEELARAMLNEGQWLINNPEFEERPASIEEFLGDDYLRIAKGVRAGVRECLVGIFGDKPNVYNLAQVQQAMFTGAIGIGKTTFASIALPYMAHWCLCLKDPQGFFELLPGSRIAFMQMSTSEKQAKEVLFGDIFARIKHSKWFEKYPFDPKFTSQVRFPKDIWIVPGDSSDTTFEGYNILGGIIDEMDSHKVTEKKDYALDGYNTIRNRITSRFGNRGLLILIGQMKKSVGFAANKYAEFLESGPEQGYYAKKLTIWDSLGWNKFLKADNVTRDSFWFDLKRKCIIPDMLAAIMPEDSVMEIPTVYRKDFEGNPEQALRDHAGIPPMVGDSFISMIDKVDSCRDRWHSRFGVAESPVGINLNRPVFAEWFTAPDTLKRAVHIDIAYSAAGDAMGIAMGHVRELKEVDDEYKPVIVIDCLIRIRPLPGQQIILSEMRDVIYFMKNKLGFNIKRVTLDGFQSTDTLQQLRKKKFSATYLSVDRQILPYHDLREAIYEERLEFPKYMTFKKNGDIKQVEIARDEILQLIDDGKKIDHPPGGSKDVSDAMAGVVSTLMGDGQFKRGMGRSSSNAVLVGSGGFTVPGLHGGVPGMGSPFAGQGIGMQGMPSVPQVGSISSLLPPVPNRLRPEGR